MRALHAYYFGATVPCYSWSGNQHAGWHVILLYMWREGGFLFPSSHTYPSTYHLFTSSSTFTYTPSSASTCSSSFYFYSSRGLQWRWRTRYMASQVCYFCTDPDQSGDPFCLHWESFGAHCTILHLPQCTSRVATVHYLEVRVELQTLNKRFLGGNPSTSSFLKKKCVFPLSPPLFHFGVIGTPFPLVFFFVFFIEDNDNLKHGGEPFAL